MSDERHIRDPEDLPALYQAANARSLSAQTSFLFWYRARLFGLLLAAAGGVDLVSSRGPVLRDDHLSLLQKLV